jgi:hypothetical protein
MSIRTARLSAPAPCSISSAQRRTRSAAHGPRIRQWACMVCHAHPHAVIRQSKCVFLSPVESPRTHRRQACPRDSRVGATAQPFDRLGTGPFYPLLVHIKRLGTRQAVPQKGEARSSLHLISAAPNPLILFGPIFRAKILNFAPPRLPLGVGSGCLTGRTAGAKRKICTTIALNLPAKSITCPPLLGFIKLTLLLHYPSLQPLGAHALSYHQSNQYQTARFVHLPKASTVVPAKQLVSSPY